MKAHYYTNFHAEDSRIIQGDTQIEERALNKLKLKLLKILFFKLFSFP